MESIKSEFGDRTRTELSLNTISSVEHGVSEPECEQSQLIPGLPNDIALSCLGRVPRKYHALLRCVSKSWRELMCSDDWFLYRERHDMKETWIYALCRDKYQQLCCYVLDPKHLKKGWKRIPGIPNRCLNRKGIGFEVSGKNLYLLGGCGWIEDATDEVYCYDAARNVWNEPAPLPVARCYFACEALNDKIYAIGGIGSNSSNPQSWDTYDPSTSNWTSHADPNVIPDAEDSIVLDGKIYIRAGSSAVSSHVYAVVYEPSSGAWQHADSDMVSGWRGPAVYIDGALYVLDQTSGVRLMMWKKDKREWLAVKRLSPLLTKPPCRLVSIGKNIFIIGKGLSTVVFDVENLVSADGVTISSSAPKLNSEDDVINCKTIAI